MAVIKTLLVVGGSGFIGRHLVNAALNQGYATTVISFHEVDKAAQIEGAEYIVADVSKMSELSSAMTGRLFSHVVNLGGYIDHSGYCNGGAKVLNTHFLGVQNLLHCLDWNTIESFVQIGSSDEYGDAPSPIREAVREAPISPYSIGKMAAGQMLQMLHRTEGFPAVTLRLFLVYGPGQDNQRFLPQVIKGCLRGESFATSQGGQKRDFCYVDDVVNGILMALSNTKVHGEIINIASGEPIKIRAVIEKIVKIVGSGTPMFGEVPYRKGESMSLYADISKARDLLGWEPEVDLDEGIARTISAYKKNHE